MQLRMMMMMMMMMILFVGVSVFSGEFKKLLLINLLNIVS